MERTGKGDSVEVCVFTAGVFHPHDNGNVRKTISSEVISPPNLSGEWLDVSETASVEVTSEDPNYPIEAAFACHGTRGWRAAVPGDQRIRLAFDVPTPIRRIQLRFTESMVERTQEFALRWYGADTGPALLARQQWNFSPAGSTVEVEDYQVDLSGVLALELEIRPGLEGRAVASLDCWRVAGDSGQADPHSEGKPNSVPGRR